MSDTLMDVKAEYTRIMLEMAQLQTKLHRKMFERANAQAAGRKVPNRKELELLEKVRLELTKQFKNTILLGELLDELEVVQDKLRDEELGI